MRTAAALLLLLCASCVTAVSEPIEQPLLDEPFFRCRVQPVLTKSCGQLACHGDGRRYYRIFGRNRLRLGLTEADRNAFLADEERSHNFSASLAMVEPGAPGASLLLLKPLQDDAGGYYHGGETEYGRGDVFADAEDRDYQLLVDWVNGATEDPACIEPGSDL
jgi:hypothetical protein